MRRILTAGQVGLVRGTSSMAAPRKYSLELCERAVRMYRTSDPKPQNRKPTVDLGVHPDALRGEKAHPERANEVLHRPRPFFAAHLAPTRPRCRRARARYD